MGKGGREGKGGDRQVNGTGSAYLSRIREGGTGRLTEGGGGGRCDAFSSDAVPFLENFDTCTFPVSPLFTLWFPRA